MLRFADVNTDGDLLELARDAATELMRIIRRRWSSTSDAGWLDAMSI